MLLDISTGNLEEIYIAIKRARAAAAFEQLRKEATARGCWTDEDIEAEIAAARRARKKK